MGNGFQEAEMARVPARGGNRKHRRTTTKVAAGAVAVSLAVGGLATGASAHGVPNDLPRSGPNIVQLAQSNPDLSILVQAVVKAGYAEPLSQPGIDLTVFAPDNDAFIALLGQLGYSSLDEVPVGALQQILLDHVLPSPVTSAQLAAWDVVDYRPTTFGYLTLDADRSPAAVNDAGIVAADLYASNGIVHVIDKVLLDPDPRPTIAQLAIATPDLSILVEAVVRTGLVDVLSEPGDYTVFAPTNAAFTSLLGALGYTSLDQVDTATLRGILLDHVVGAELDAVDVGGVIDTGAVIPSLGGLGLTFTSAPLAVNGVPIAATDIEGSNGTVHVITNVLLP
jgi:transforming growth factor-beta-induced protein